MALTEILRMPCSKPWCSAGFDFTLIDSILFFMRVCQSLMSFCWACGPQGHERAWAWYFVLGTSYSLSLEDPWLRISWACHNCFGHWCHCGHCCQRVNGRRPSIHVRHSALLFVLLLRQQIGDARDGKEWGGDSWRHSLDDSFARLPRKLQKWMNVSDLTYRSYFYAIFESAWGCRALAQWEPHLFFLHPWLCSSALTQHAALSVIWT